MFGDLTHSHWAFFVCLFVLEAIHRCMMKSKVLSGRNAPWPNSMPTQFFSARTVAQDTAQLFNANVPLWPLRGQRQDRSRCWFWRLTSRHNKQVCYVWVYTHTYWELLTHVKCSTCHIWFLLWANHRCLASEHLHGTALHPLITLSSDSSSDCMMCVFPNPSLCIEAPTSISLISPLSMSASWSPSHIE